MAGGKISPRQKMINMMYLVLTALLALNVSKEILKSFHLMEASFAKTGENLAAKNKSSLEALAAVATDPSNAAKAARAKPYYERAQQATKVSSEFYTYLDGVIKELEKRAKGRKQDGEKVNNIAELASPDDMENHANYFVNEGNGKKLQDKINSTRQALIDLLKQDTAKGVKIDPSVYKQIEMSTGLYALDPKDAGAVQKTWVSMYLEHSPLAGVMAMLTKIKNDCRNLENEVLTQLASNIDATTMKFDKIAAKIVPYSSAVMTGEKFEADVMLVAYNSTANAEMFLGGTPLKVEDGVGKVSITASSVGEHGVEGYIMADDGTGTQKKLTYSTKYTVFAPAASVAAEKMNIFYIGLDNPIAVSVPGVASEKVNATASAGATITKSGAGKFNVKVNGSTREIMITPTAQISDGSNRSFTATKFRVKNLPIPRVTIGPLIDGSKTVGKSELSAQNMVVAGYGPDFPYEGLRFTVTGFTCIVSTKTQGAQFRTVTGSSLGSVKSLFGGLKSGDLVSITSVRATGPDGASRQVPGVTVAIQ